MLAMSLVFVAACKKAEKPVDPKTAIEGYWKLVSVTGTEDGKIVTKPVADMMCNYFHFKSDKTLKVKVGFPKEIDFLETKIPAFIVETDGTWSISNNALTLDLKYDDTLKELGPQIGIQDKDGGKINIAKINDKELALEEGTTEKDKQTLNFVKSTKEEYDAVKVTGIPDELKKI